MPMREETAERHVVLENKLTELARLTAFARDVGREEGLGEDQVFALELCLEEAAANIITHGVPTDHIWVSIARVPPYLVARLEDDGTPFDPTAVPARAAPLSLELAQLGGLGIPLIRKLTTDMRYERVGGRNRLTLEFTPRSKVHGH
jgi:anti-sigma regulatory factor (Ser/Thr protein kinase)